MERRRERESESSDGSDAEYRPEAEAGSNEEDEDEEEGEDESDLGLSSEGERAFDDSEEEGEEEGEEEEGEIREGRAASVGSRPRTQTSCKARRLAAGRAASQTPYTESDDELDEHRLEHGGLKVPGRMWKRMFPHQRRWPEPSLNLP